MANNNLRRQIKNRAIKYGDFTLSSGKKSKYYLDLKLAYTDPKVMREIVSSIKETLKAKRFDQIAGMELGAVPIVVALSLELDVPFVIVRKGKKELVGVGSSSD
jgi:orotate phosphoribosyltransferase